MKKTGFWLALLSSAVVFLPVVEAQSPDADSGEVKTIVTVESRHGQQPGEVTQQDVMVSEGKTRDKVTSWQPAQGDHAQLDLILLLDDSSGVSLGTQLGDLRKFITAQAPTTRVGVAYMRDGSAQIVQNPTEDRAQAAKSLRLPLGEAGVNASPYLALSDLIKRWPKDSLRREIVMVSDGFDRLYGQADYQDPYLSAAIEDAQRAGIIVYTIYNPGAGHVGHSYWLNYWGQLYLSQVAEETGGESYYIGFSGPAVAFAPYLDDVGRKLGSQYLLAFIPKPEQKSGFQKVKIRTELHGAELVSAGKVFVPGSSK